MDYALVILIATAVFMHLLEHYIKKCRKWIAIVNVFFHLSSFALFALLGRELIDLFVFFLSSSIVSLLMMMKEVKNGF